MSAEDISLQLRL